MLRRGGRAGTNPRPDDCAYSLLFLPSGPLCIRSNPPAIAYGLMTAESSFSTGKPISYLAEGHGHWRAGPPYFKKQAGNYYKEAISGLSKKQYLEFLESFFVLAHQNTKKSTRMAFVNAD